MGEKWAKKCHATSNDTGFVTKYGTHLEPKIPTNERGDSVFPPLGGSWPFLKHKIYSKMKDRFPDYTYVFEPTFSDIYFTGWFYFSDIFSVFAGLTGFISGFLNFFYYFIFPLYFTVTCIYDSYFCKLLIGHEMRILSGASRWDT